MKKKMALFWGVLTFLIILIALSCDTTKPKPPVIHYQLNMMHDAIDADTYADFGLTLVTISAELKDEDGNFLEGETINFTWQNTDASITLGTISTPTRTTDNNGKATVTFEDNGQAGTINVSASYADEYDNEADETISFSVLSVESQADVLTMNTSGTDNNMVLVADNAPDMEYNTLFNAFVRDDIGNPVQNLNVHFTNLSMLGGLVETEDMTDDIGKATVTLSTFGSELGDAEVKAYVTIDELARAVESSSIELTFENIDFKHLERADGEISDTLVVSFISELQYLISTQVDGISLMSIPGNVYLDENNPDSTYTVSLSATVVDESGAAVTGVPVHFENTSSWGALTGNDVLTNSQGIAVTSLLGPSGNPENVTVNASVMDPLNDGSTVVTTSSTISVQYYSSLAAGLNTWTVSGVIPDGEINTVQVDTLYARVTDSVGGAMEGVYVNFERVTGSGLAEIGVLSSTSGITNSHGIVSTIYTALASEIIVDGMMVQIEISVSNSVLDSEVVNFTLNNPGSPNVEYNVDRFEWYKGFAIENSTVTPLFVGNESNLEVSSSFDYLLLVASIVDEDGVRINRLPVQFSIDNIISSPNGDLSSNEEYSCCQQDSVGVNEFVTPADLTLLNFVIDPAHPDEANGLVPILYYNQMVDVCDNIVAEVVDPLDDSVTLFTSSLNICTAAPELTFPEDDVTTLTFTTSPDNVLLFEGVQDSTYRVVLNAIVKDVAGVPVENVHVDFINDTPQYGILQYGQGMSNALGYARDTLYVASEDEGNIDLRAVVTDSQENTLEASTTVSVFSVETPSEIHHIQAWAQEPIILITNPSQVYSDTLYARALTEEGANIPDAPILFELTDPNSGSISSGQVLTNNEGIASVIFFTNVGIETGTVDLSVSVPGAPLVPSTNIQITIAGQEQYPDIVNSLDLFAFPEEVVILRQAEQDTTYSIEFNSIVKDIYGVAVQNVPVYFMNLTSGIGTLSQSLAYSDSIGIANAILNLDPNNTGIANIKSYILSLEDDSDTLFTAYRSVNIQSEYEMEVASVTSLLAWASTSVINVTRTDSTYCDTLSAVAMDANGGGVSDIDITFSSDSPDIGFLDNTLVTSDSLGIGMNTFCLIPAYIDTAGTGEFSDDVNITVTIEGSTVDPGVIEIQIVDNIAECPDCIAELSVNAVQTELPFDDNDGNPVFSTTVWATYVDTLGYGPENGDIIQFQSLRDSSGTFVPFASIEPYGYFQNDTARVIFNMTNDAGLAFVIGTYDGLSDTTNIALNSNTFEYIEFIPPVPSEIMVEDGGGVEATEVSAILRDANANPVSEDYLVFFEITMPSPSGVHFDNDLTSDIVESSNGIASVTVNSGTVPGTIRMHAVVFDLEDTEMLNPLGEAFDIPVTIHTGPPAYGNITASYVDLATIGGGMYELPISISLWDLHSNPVDDSTTVWLSVYEFSPTWNVDTSYVPGDIVMWAEEGDAITDSLVYVCLDSIIAIPPSGDGQSEEFWDLSAQPALINGEAKTGMPNSNGEDFDGIAWAELYYSSMPIFDFFVIKAQTYGGNNVDGGADILLIDSRTNNNGGPFQLPILPGAVNLSCNPVFWDFSTFPNDNNPPDIDPGCYTGIISCNASLTDFYMESIDNGRLQLSTVGGVLLDPFPANDPLWDGNPVQISDPNGSARWYFRYNIALCPVTDPQTCTDENDCEACEYDDFPSTVWVNLLDPQQMTSNQIEISLMRSGGECENCP